MKNKAVFLDRDGVIIEDLGHIREKSQVRLIGRCAEAIKMLNKDYLAIIISNQSVVARGLATVNEVEELNSYLIGMLSENGAKIDAVYFCPHHPNFTGPCKCRKPGTGLLEKAQSDFNVSMDCSYMVGDKPIDVAAGKKAGCRTILVTGAGAKVESQPAQKPDFECRNLLDAARIILAQK